MELTTRGRYAVMAMADLARHVGQGPVALAQIADRQQLSLAYLEQLFARLRRAGLVDSARGRSGGYRLGRSPDQISIAEIMRAVEEGTQLTRCDGGASKGCVGEERCITHHLWLGLSQHISEYLSRVTLAAVVAGGPIVQRPESSGPLDMAAE